MLKRLSLIFLVGFCFLLGSCVNSLNHSSSARQIKGAKHSDDKRDLVVDVVDLAGEGDANGVRALLSSDSKHVINGKALNNALFASVQGGNPDTVKILISAGANKDAKRNGGYTPLMDAIFSRDEKIVAELVTLGANVNLLSESGRSALRYSIHENLTETAKFLISKGAEVNSVDVAGVTPLIQAVWHNESEMVQFLIENGADVNMRDHEGHTALFYAKDKNEDEVVDLLRHAGAKE